jgi:hypothetical protein
MTMPYGTTEEPDVTYTERESIPVHVVSTDARPIKPEAAEFAHFRTVLVANVVNALSTVPGAQRLIPRSLRRLEARIVVNSTAVNQPATDGVLIGTQAEINTGNPATIGSMGGYLQIGDSLTYKGQPELWVAFPVGNTAPVYVTVLDAQFASDPGAWREDQE